MIQGSRLRSRQTPVALAIETIRRAEIRTEQRFARNRDSRGNNVANFFIDSCFDSEQFLTNAEWFTNAATPCGTFDQDGNVYRVA